mmetsp:Transcript_11847/g.17405  ORF Transcript_11847/g.17405 Transcript_11847/m.17405 type:complete len:152 (-) Transcript_11847:101-556(-)|eukprot:CAMPEP_0194046490 /NCGR_PEP_ID=MMETSP0009_2-20130614/21240_1 /TAXON_ID=210454 /ORGANISM="Grammatophora oceanica, Strain CCMP 410" /LENGTH=151 /DNA_ID=CAMNT_0038691795 /DNA_START=108 /DNA_END=563 /DNA_ORIENTATION=+
MTQKDSNSNPPIVKASVVQPADYDTSTPATAPVATSAVASPLGSSMPPAKPATTTTTYTVPTTPAPAAPGAHHRLPGMGRSPASIVCPYCQQGSITKVREQVDGVTIVAVIVLLLVFWPLFWLPLCMPSCKATEHYCGNCQRKVGHADACS